jgi:hypothetical protein
MPVNFKVKMFVNSDFSDLLRLFNDNKVRYLVIGGYAYIQYAEPRYTKDLDLWISTDVENAAAVFRSLQDFGAPLVDMTEDDFAEEGYFYQMGIPPVRIDILMGIPGIEFDDLIVSKRASGRTQDLLDADVLSQTDS